MSPESKGEMNHEATGEGGEHVIRTRPAANGTQTAEPPTDGESPGSRHSLTLVFLFPAHLLFFICDLLQFPPLWWKKYLDLQLQ